MKFYEGPMVSWHYASKGKGRKCVKGKSCVIEYVVVKTKGKRKHTLTPEEFAALGDIWTSRGSRKFKNPKVVMVARTPPVGLEVMGWLRSE